MLNELDDTIRELLVREGRLDPAEVEVSFDIPNRDWSKGISKPTVNCYLFDIRENRELRHTGATLERPGANGAARRRQPMFVALTYLITAWTRAVEDEHRLLFHALATLMRFGVIPEDVLQGALRGHGLPVHAHVAQPDGVLKSPGEFWTALENHLKPSLSYVVTLALDYDRVAAGPPVLQRGVRYHAPSGGRRDGPLRFGGTLRGDGGAPVAGAEVWVEGHRASVTTGGDGRYGLQVPAPGRYTLAARAGGVTRRREIEVPAPEFDLVLPAGLDA